VVPPTIQALLAARLDQLDPEERSVLERGAVEGLVFHRGAVAALAPDEQQVDGRLVTLVRKDLVRPDSPLLPHDDAYRFRHLLIRDTAYEALPKAARAELHERFADWLEVHGASLVELDEILGYHLEQAYRYRLELGPADDTTAGLSDRAAAHLLAGAAHAQDKDDFAAEVVLLSRAVELLPAEHARLPRAQFDLAAALIYEGDLDRAARLLDDAEAGAATAGDEAIEARSERLRAELLVQVDPSATMADALEVAKRALDTLERLGDDEGAVEALRMVGTVTFHTGNCAAAHDYLRRVLERAESVRPSVVSQTAVWLVLTAVVGPMSHAETVEMCEQLRARFSSKKAQAWTHIGAGAASCCLGEVDDGLEELDEGRALLRDLGDRLGWAGSAIMASETQLWAGMPERAYAVTSEATEFLGSVGETGYKASVGAGLAMASLELGREDEALQHADESTAAAAADDFEPRATSALVRARVLARRGDLVAADEQLATAAALVDPTDYRNLRLQLVLARAEVARLSGSQDEERRQLQEALEIADSKVNRLAAGRIREQLERLVAG
jgi:tetratricopeptide (TPR) repeat protein